jgi:putative ABC transport system substrate-binding protein
MQRREFITLLGAAAATWPLAARAQQPPKQGRVVFFSPGTMEDFRTQSFRQGLRELGYVEGQNISVEYVFATPDLLAPRASDIAARRPDAIVAATTPVALAAMHATTTIPIVAAAIADPVAVGLADSLARPGRNVTSLSNLGSDISGKRLELLRELRTGLKGVGVLENSQDPSTAVQVDLVKASAGALGLTVRTFDARPGIDLAQAFRAVPRGAVQALIIPQSGWFLNNRAEISRLAIESGLPTMAGSRVEADAGMLMAYGTDLKASFRRSAYLLDKILKGTRPAEIPVEQPTEFELVINLKTAKALGIAVPPTLLTRADEVIE